MLSSLIAVFYSVVTGATPFISQDGAWESGRQIASTEHLARGEDFLSRMKLPSAQAAYEKALDQNPLSALALYRLGFSYAFLGHTEEALDLWSQLLRRKGSFGSAIDYRWLSSKHKQLKRLHYAEKLSPGRENYRYIGAQLLDRRLTQNLVRSQLQPTALSVSSDGKRLWIADAYGFRVLKVGLETGVERSISTDGFILDLAIDHERGQVASASFSGRRVIVYDLESSNQIYAIDDESEEGGGRLFEPWAVSFDDKGHLLILERTSGRIQRFSQVGRRLAETDDRLQRLFRRNAVDIETIGSEIWVFFSDGRCGRLSHDLESFEWSRELGINNVQRVSKADGDTVLIANLEGIYRFNPRSEDLIPLKFGWPGKPGRFQSSPQWSYAIDFYGGRLAAIDVSKNTVHLFQEEESYLSTIYVNLDITLRRHYPVVEHIVSFRNSEGRPINDIQQDHLGEVFVRPAEGNKRNEWLSLGHPRISRLDKKSQPSDLGIWFGNDGASRNLIAHYQELFLELDKGLKREDRVFFSFGFGLEKDYGDGITEFKTTGPSSQHLLEAFSSPPRSDTLAIPGRLHRFFQSIISQYDRHHGIVLAVHGDLSPNDSALPHGIDVLIDFVRTHGLKVMVVDFKSGRYSSDWKDFSKRVEGLYVTRSTISLILEWINTVRSSSFPRYLLSYTLPEDMPSVRSPTPMLCEIRVHYGEQTGKDIGFYIQRPEDTQN